MRSPRSFHGSFALPLVLVCLAMSGGVSACSNAEGSGDTAIVVEVLQDEVTIENKTGTGLSKGEVSVIPQGFARPFVTNIAYMTNGSKQSFPLGNFRASDGSKFRRDVVKGKSVKVTIKDVSGKDYVREIPFK